MGTTFISQNNSTDHLTFAPFESKLIIFLEEFNSSILVTGEKKGHGHGALNPFFIAESRV